MKEIGGYFELGGLKNRPYHKKAIALNTATNAVIYLIKAKEVQKIYLPYYLCDCLNKIKKYCKVEYYEINKDFTPKLDFRLKENEYLYFVNYFGMFDNSEIEKFREKYNNIIVDNVHAFFQMPIDKVDTIYSCRKFFGVPDGAYLYTNVILKENIPQDKSKDRFYHMIGRLEENANTHFKDYKKNEELLLNLDLAYMSKSTNLIMGSIQYESIKNRRTENFSYLNKNLKDINFLKIDNIDGAYMYPYYTSNANKVKKALLENNIYVPTLWPNVLEQNEDKIAYDYTLNILFLPCDQRYGKVEMNKIIKIIKEEQ